MERDTPYRNVLVFAPSIKEMFYGIHIFIYVLQVYNETKTINQWWTKHE